MAWHVWLMQVVGMMQAGQGSRFCIACGTTGRFGTRGLKITRVAHVAHVGCIAQSPRTLCFDADEKDDESRRRHSLGLAFDTGALGGGAEYSFAFCAASEMS